MPDPSTTVTPRRQQQPKPSRMTPLLQRDRVWLLLIMLIIVALFLGGCSTRGHGCHAACSSGDADAWVALFYVVYVLGVIIVGAAGG